MGYSYHDVIVYCNNVEYKPSSNYALRLMCNKAGGWSLFWEWDGRSRILGGEFHGKPFCIMIGNLVVCGKKPKKKDIRKSQKIGGWNGVVINE